MLLITGGTGYLGSALVELLRRRNMQVRAVVRSERRAAALPDGVEPVVADLADPASLRRAVSGCDAVFHLAASVGGGLEEQRRLNVAGTEAVLAAAIQAGVRRFVHTSSAAAIVGADGLVDEASGGSTAMTDPYSVTKSEAERLVLATRGIEAVVVNPVSIYGPSPAGPASYNALFAAAAAGEVDAVVDTDMGWVLAEDVALGHLLAYERGEPGRRYVLCGEVAGFGAVLHRYAELVGSPHRVRVLPAGSSLGAGAGTFARRSEVYGKLGPVRVRDAGARALGFAPSGLADGLARTASWLTDRR
ncbi:NAD-dependent epimerase/dehydratase family protein [Pseudonocardia acaciae]|uniref:NAD-dependent epimerase/dehydratase family protein n=1 Tax=Pseudonocardia acaciae TaxID=551276 RepID=UPI000685F153|nr:NAD-dependent epimerase/dehydratase family protein [Pseudonocardia acaciae]